MATRWPMSTWPPSWMPTGQGGKQTRAISSPWCVYVCSHACQCVCVWICVRVLWSCVRVYVCMYVCVRVLWPCIQVWVTQYTACATQYTVCVCVCNCVQHSTQCLQKCDKVFGTENNGLRLCGSCSLCLLAKVVLLTDSQGLLAHVCMRAHVHVHIQIHTQGTHVLVHTHMHMNTHMQSYSIKHTWQLSSSCSTMNMCMHAQY